MENYQEVKKTDYIDSEYLLEDEEEVFIIYNNNLIIREDLLKKKLHCHHLKLICMLILQDNILIKL